MKIYNELPDKFLESGVVREFYYLIFNRFNLIEKLISLYLRISSGERKNSLRFLY